MGFLRKRSVLAVAAFILGFFVGLVIFGWGLTPVQYTGAGPQDLLLEYQQIYIQTVADLHSHDLNQENVTAAFVIWPEADQTICAMAQVDPDQQGSAARLTAIAVILNGEGCTAAVLAPPEEEGGFNLLAICVVLFLMALLVGVIYYVFRLRGAPDDDQETPPLQDEPEDFPLASVEPEADRIQATPIATFETRYARGNDTYDDSFIIESSQGEFLGECGVVISETIGMETPKNVTAFEVWLFDQNDIPTVTKVVMSEHAFHDEAIRAKLAPKGEPVLARMNETIVLETTTLIINADIVEMTYGSGSSPPESFLEHLTIELSAWVKTGDLDDADGAGSAD